MKKLVFLAILAGPAFAGPLKFSDPQYLELSKGDAVLGQEFKVYCNTTGRTKSDCLSDLSGGGNLMQEAVSKCIRTVGSGLQKFHINPEEIAKRGGLANGIDYKIAVVHKDEWGTHAHLYSKADDDLAVLRYRNLLITDALSTFDASKSVGSKSTEVTMGGSIGVSAGVLAEVGVEFSPSSTSGTTITPAKLPKAQLDAINIEAEKARGNGFLMSGVAPSIFCAVWLKQCDGAKGSKIPNPFYDPKAKDDSKFAPDNKSNDKKGAENPPKHEEDKAAD